MKRIITLTTDFGLKDHYVGTMKGVMLSVNENVVPVDITHSVPPHDVSAASFAVNAAYRYFPEGTVHLAVVDPGVGTERRALAVSAGGHFFVGPDNGIFSFVFRSCPDFLCSEIKNREFVLEPVSATFHGRDIFAPAAAHLSLGVSVEEFGPEASDPETVSPPGCRREGENVRGTVVYSDRFGNLVTSIPASEVGNRTEAVVKIGGKTITGISSSYACIAPGEILAVEGSTGFIEISVNRGSAAEVFGDSVPEVLVVCGERRN